MIFSLFERAGIAVGHTPPPPPAPTTPATCVCDGQTLNVSHATVRGVSNRILGHCNTIYGRLNDVSGNCNRVFGSDNGVFGNFNHVEGDYNYIRGDCNEPIIGNRNKAVGAFNALRGRDCRCEGRLSTINGVPIHVGVGRHARAQAILAQLV